jgi:hypothetical protein
MGVIAPLWHTIAFPASYIIYGNALIVIGLVGIPDWRWFFGASVLIGSFVALCLWRLHKHD